MVAIPAPGPRAATRGPVSHLPAVLRRGRWARWLQSSLPSVTFSVGFAELVAVVSLSENVNSLPLLARPKASFSSPFSGAEVKLCLLGG